MYPILLTLHSWFRWIVLICLILAIAKGLVGWKRKKVFSKRDNLIRHGTATVCHIQLLLGVYLYCISPVVKYFFHSFSDALHQREIRFFGMEHISIMLIAITIITIGSAKAKRKTIDQEKFRTMTIWFAIGLLLILSSIPWEFSPLTSRPSFRTF